MNLEIKFQAHDLSERGTHLNYSRHKLLIISMNCKYLLSVSGFLSTVYIIFSFYSHLKFESTKLLPEILRFCFSDEKKSLVHEIILPEISLVSKYCRSYLHLLFCLELIMICCVRYRTNIWYFSVWIINFLNYMVSIVCLSLDLQVIWCNWSSVCV